MRKKISILNMVLIAALAGALAGVFPAAEAFAISAKAEDYYSRPPLMVGSSKPAILLILSKDMNIYAPAYSAPADHDNDGRLDVGFNPGVVYYGIFDPWSCYTYNWKDDGINSGKEIENLKDWSKTPDVEKRGRFIRLGPSIEDKEDAPGKYPDAKRLPNEIRNGYDDAKNGRPGFRAPHSVAGICPASNKVVGRELLDSHGKNTSDKNQERWRTWGETRIWSGNWLNWITSSRLDVIRQALYGGKRVVDRPGRTILAAEWVPQNAGVWSYDDFTKYFWLDYNEGAPYYDSTNFTPVNPNRFSGKYRQLHSYGRSGDKLFIYDNIWFMRQKDEVTNHEGFRSFVAYYPPKFRHQYTPLVYLLESYADKNQPSYWEVRVEACRELTRAEVFNYYGRLDWSAGRTGAKKPAKAELIPSSALLEAGDYCQRYAGGFKPVGIIQRSSSRDQAMFGLLTGAFNDLNRWDAGWMRSNIAPVGTQIDGNGVFTGTSRNNIFKMLDAVEQLTKPRLAPLNTSRNAEDAILAAHGDGWEDPLPSNFGNPLGEMMYQGLLYFARNNASSYSSWPGPGTMANAEAVSLPRLGAPGNAPWKSPLFANQIDCLKPVILLLSSSAATHDGDMIPGTPHGLSSRAGPIPNLSLEFHERYRFTNHAGLARTFSMKAYLDAITRLEGFGGKTYYLANINIGAPGARVANGTSTQEPDPADTNLCVPRTLSSLADVRGLCPSSPQGYGTYSVAAAAYYANTHDFDNKGANVRTYAVALPSAFPEINLESKGRRITVSPMAMSVEMPCAMGDNNPRFCLNGGAKPAGFKRLGPFTTSIIHWRADDQGRVYSGAIFAGFSGDLEEGPYQLDAPARYYFDLIRECRPNECSPAANAPLKESFRYDGKHPSKEGYPTRDDERNIAYVFFHQPFEYGYPATHRTKPTKKKYAQHVPDVFNTMVNNVKSPEDRCDRHKFTLRELVSGCGSANERQAAIRILKNFEDGRYAAAPFKRHREWVYKNWDHAGRPNYVMSGERPRNFHVLAYQPKRWSQLPAYFHRPTSLLHSESDPDPALMQSYARKIYPEFGRPNERRGSDQRQALMRTFPGAGNFLDYTTNDIAYKVTDPATKTSRSPIDFVFDESQSVFIDRPFTDLGYEEVMDVYGYIGEPYKIYKKVGSPEEIDEAIGVAVFVYSLEEPIDLTDRPAPMTIGYHLQGGLNFGASKEENSNRALGDASGVYLEIQNEHNYMGGSPQKVVNQGLAAKYNSGEQFGLMGVAHPQNTPPTCYRAGTVNFEPKGFMAAELDRSLFKGGVYGAAQMPGFLSDTHKTTRKKAIPACGSARLPLTSTRFFRFPRPGALTAKYLPDPLWLAAKYGGFKDDNHDGVPQKTEFDSYPPPNGDGVPDNYFYASNLTELKGKLAEAIERIMSSLSVGTATSASVNSVLGGGLTVRTYYQAFHKPSSVHGFPEIRWLGGIYALFIDPWGNMREDTNRNGRLDLSCGFPGEPGADRGPGAKGDWIVQFVDCPALPTAAERGKCLAAKNSADLKIVARLVADQNGRNLQDKRPARTRHMSLQHVNTVWDLGKTLAIPRNKADVVNPRSSFPGLNSPKRRVYFWQENLSSAPARLGNLNLMDPARANALAPYLGANSAAQAKELIEYVLGWERPGWRSRTTASPWPDFGVGRPVTCRLGDIINSQPVIVGSPFSHYDATYEDASYARYRLKRSKRRHLALVGANDGMLHAINMGFPLSLKEGLTGYEDKSRDHLGRELWAFIPQSVLPHLKWLKEPDYAHSYYVDMTPTVVEIKDPAKSEAEGGPWRTIILGSLRYGGRAIEVGKPPKYSWSEVFALDVTEPDKEPILLWRFSDPRMGLVVARPTAARSNQGSDTWQVLIGSGPTYDDYDASRNVVIPSADGPRAYNGHSNQSAKLFVFDAMKGPKSGVRVIDTKRPKSFIAGLHVVAAPASSIKRGPGGETSWNNNLAYLSLNQSAPGHQPLCLESAKDHGSFLDGSNPADLCPPGPKGRGDGTMDKGGIYRLDMSGPPSSWASRLKLLIDTQKPVSSPVNTTYDAHGRLWVLFGTGRYFSDEDSAPCLGAADYKACRINHVNHIYGVKEPVDPFTGALAMTEVKDSDLIDVSNIIVYPSGLIAAKTATGQLQAVKLNGQDLGAYQSVAAAIADSSSSGYKRALNTSSRQHFGTENDKPNSQGLGWWDRLNYETIIEQAAVAPYGSNGSVMSLASFMPEAGNCGSYGKSYGILLDTFTGLPKPDFSSSGFWGDNAFQENAGDQLAGEKPVSDHVSVVAGKSSAPVFVVTGGNESKRGQFEIVNSDGTVTVFKLPENKTVRGGVISWREILDISSEIQ